MQYRVLLAGEHWLTLQACRDALRRESDFVVVGETDLAGLERRDGWQTVNALVLEQNGQRNRVRELLARLRSEPDRPHMVIVSRAMEAEHAAALFREGVQAYLLRDSVSQHLPTALQTAVRGQVFLDPAVARRLLHYSLQFVPVDQAGADANLRDGEIEVLRRLAEGQPAKRIALDLHLSLRAVHARRERIMEKLGLYSLAELTKYAVRSGLTPLHDEQEWARLDSAE